MSNSPNLAKEDRRNHWDYAIGMSKVDGGEHSQGFLDLVVREINDEIPEGETLKRTLERWKKLGFKDDDLLAQAETELSAARMEELQRAPLQSEFNYGRLCETHRRIFQDIFEWAGQFRTRDIFKHEQVLGGASVDYSKATDISSDIQKAVSDMTCKNYASMSLDKLAENFALDLRDIWEVHPFREGNTRTTVHFCCDFIESQGIPLNRTLLASNSKFTRDALTAASKTYESYSGHTQHEPLIRIVKDSLCRIERT